MAPPAQVRLTSSVVQRLVYVAELLTVVAGTIIGTLSLDVMPNIWGLWLWGTSVAAAICLLSADRRPPGAKYQSVILRVTLACIVVCCLILLTAMGLPIGANAGRVPQAGQLATLVVAIIGAEGAAWAIKLTWR